MLPLLVILVFGTIDGARIFATWNRVKNAAREGAEYAQIYPMRQADSATTCAGQNNIVARARNEGADLAVSVVPAVTPSCADMTKSPPSAIQPGDTVSVNVSVPFTFITPIARGLWGNPTVRAAVKVTVQG